MRRKVLLASLPLSIAAFGQCDFDPVISPGPAILCPGESVELSVGEFDAYQWYQGNEPFSEDPTIIVDNFNSGVEYSVEVTLDGCTEMSPPVLIDGWVFLPPFVIHGGDEPIGIGPMGELTFCEGDTLTLELGQPYTTNIIWTNNGVMIPGENSSTLVITETGVYSASAAPEVCPNSLTPLGVAVDVQFIQAQQPEIVVNGDELCAFPLGNSYIWYLNGAVLGSENTECITTTEAGAYTVFVNYGSTCNVISEPYLITGIGELSDRPWQLFPNPADGHLNVTMDPQIGEGAIYSVFDQIGKEITSGWMPLNGMLQLDLGILAPGSYLFQAARNGKALAPASRFTIVK